jgi:hypothetical protein
MRKAPCPERAAGLGPAARLRGEQQGGGLRGERVREVKTLHLLAAEQAQPLQMRCRLDTLTDDLHPEVVSEADDRLHGRVRAWVGQHVDHEAVVDLQRVAGEPAQQAQRRRAGAEVVEVGPDAARPEVGERAQRALDVVRHRRLGDLEA